MQIINLYALSDWQTLPAKQALVFEYPDAVRAVQLLLNLETVTSLYIQPEDSREDTRLLVTAGPGKVRVDFDAVGTFSVFADEQAGEVQFQCTEFQQAHFEPVDETSFTEIVQRRAIDPLFEEMWYRANKNMEARLNALQSQHQQQLAAVLNKVEANVDPGNSSETSGEEGGNESGGDPGAPPAGGETGS